MLQVTIAATEKELPEQVVVLRADARSLADAARRPSRLTVASSIYASLEDALT